MNCTRCNSNMIIQVFAHSKDLNNVRYKGKEHQGYLPSVTYICSGDDVDIEICLQCGQTQGIFPTNYDELEDIINEDKWDDI